MTADLFDVVLTEISIVDRPSNPGAEVVLFKRDAAQPQEEVPMTEKTEPVVKTEGVAPDATLTPDLAAIEALIAKSESRLDELTATLTEKNGLIEKMQAELAELRQSNTPLVAQAAESSAIAKSDSSPIEDVLKQAPEAVQKALATLTERVEKAESESRRYAEQIEKAEWTAKALPLVEHLPTSAEVMGGILQRVAKGNSTVQDADELERVFKAVNQAARAGGTLFKELGSAHAASVNTTSRIESMAEEVRKQAPELTPQQAVAQVLAQHPTLYTDYLIEHRAAAAA